MGKDFVDMDMDMDMDMIWIWIWIWIWSDPREYGCVHCREPCFLL